MVKVYSITQCPWCDKVKKYEASSVCMEKFPAC